MDLQNFIRKFQIPEVAYPFINKIFTKEEIEFVDKMDKHAFTKKDIEKIIYENSEAFIKNSYKRGVISLVDEETSTYKIANFYSRLDIFSISEQEVYRSIPKEEQLAMDAWYFKAYYDGLDLDFSVRPTEDEILPLNKVLEFIDTQDRPVYLNYCDCRSLRGECGKPTKTCITYRNGINTFAHRGLSEEINKERAKEIVKNADKKGLMHTVNSNGICNCCGDCCYLFRSQEKRNSSGFWPKTNQIIELDSDKCIKCGACIKRCHFDVFTKVDGVIKTDISKCVGCGICSNSCPTKALKLQERK
ncbi:MULTISPECIES: 4Fe-4S binding protein [Clostridium]|uniref:4Fe-4S binding protein n=1 Tax=Clostridium TaxID=1485 RepID=UPI000CDA835C|nr:MULTISPECIES: 4Fe-4S binding protein [Clostridium]MBN7573449.1 4Fe-4S binding protein [Clostridium beijerinckii]MBN7578786.1 4Fe-4S binding protein [Clostridium beijerinckii]MBN7583222.1 4Fe-4S binding protein [Clostridium beijerinckii]MBO0519376.1 4Fe-4S binding protein [Clostridium beijerinckii]MZK49098.1 4Fe-4S dicluster domain-containing protein [Clostridium beijerinckii]